MQERISCLSDFTAAADCALILSFIRHLAGYEKMSDQAAATEELLRESSPTECNENFKQLLELCLSAAYIYVSAGSAGRKDKI